MMSATHKLGHRRPLGAPVVEAVRIGTAAGIPCDLPHIDARLDRRLGIRRNMLFGPFVAACTGSHCHIPAALHLRQNAGVLQHLAGGRVLKDTFAIHLRIVAEGTRY